MAAEDEASRAEQLDKVHDAAQHGAEQGAKKSDTSIALKVAALSTMAALLGSTIGVGGSVYVAKQQLEQQLTFRLEERKREAYLNYLTAAGELHGKLKARSQTAFQENAKQLGDDETPTAPTAPASPTPQEKKAKDKAEAAELKTLTQAAEALNAPLAQVAIYGAKDVVATARKLELELRTSTSAEALRTNGTTAGTPADQVSVEIEKQLAKTQEAYDSYVASVREELGILDKK